MINRNRIYDIKKGETLFSVPLKKASQNKLILDIEICIDSIWIDKFYKKLKNSYGKSKQFDNVIGIIINLFKNNIDIPISELAIKSIIEVYDYLDIKFEFLRSSEINPNYFDLKKADRLIKLSLSQGKNNYVNLIGGKEIYDKKYFASKNLVLNFIETKFESYKQFKSPFYSGLSIIDLLMHCDKKFIKDTFNSYTFLISKNILFK